MSKQNNTTKSSYNHLSSIERGKIELLHKHGKSQAEIARELGRNRSTISRELKRGTATQMKNQNEKIIYYNEYFAETGQARYKNNRKNLLGYHTFVTKRVQKKRTNVILKLLKNQERGSLMKSIITEEIKLRQRAVEYAIKHDNNAKAARKYHTTRQQIARWRSRYDGTAQSLLPKSRRPLHHPNEHKTEELELIRKMYKRYNRDGLAEIYVQCQSRGYTRSYGAMKKMIKKLQLTEKKEKRTYPKSKWTPIPTTYPGEKVQIDIKYVPQHCIGWDSKGIKYYQITAIDEFSRKRICKIVDEKSVTHTAAFLDTLEKKFGFRIKTVQTDNGREFTNDPEVTTKKTIFEQKLEEKGIKHIKTRPYSPWQNGKVERSHREDGRRFYNRVFKSLDSLIKAHTRYISRGNNVARCVLNFKSPNQIVQQHLLQSA